MKTFLIALLSFSVFGYSCTSENAKSDEIEGKVVAIADGDTFTLLTNINTREKIRLYGIDCPEKKQTFGNVARERLSELIYNRRVTIDVISTDRYKRLVGMVYVEGLNVNEQLLKEGLAWHYVQYDSNPFWNQLEINARKIRIGLWKDTLPTPPWNFRKR
jgi:endonuclease YncB( thermonuclease family)